MKITEMIKREDFYKTNNDTLSKYFMKKYSSSCVVYTVNTCRKSTFYVLKNLNAIISNKPSRKIKDYIYTEYKVNDNFVKRLVVKVYLFLSLKFPRIFADKSIIIQCDTKLIDYNNLLIYPCNRKIRIFNFEENTVDVILKNGFSNQTIINEINFRNKYSESFIQPIMEHDDISYRELIIDGIPLARISQKLKYTNIIKISLNYMKILHEKTSKKLLIKDYINNVRKDIFKLLSFSMITNKVLLENYKKIDSYIINNTNDFMTTIEIGLSHGDLQHGNVWMDRRNNQVKIIDWESTAFRSKWYDIFILNSGTRKKENLLNLFSKKEFIKSMFLLKNDREYIMVSNILLIEDFQYTVKEQLSLPNKFGHDFLFKYIKFIVDEIIDGI